MTILSIEQPSAKVVDDRWRRFCRYEPRLGKLAQEAKALSAHDHQLRSACWPNLKSELESLVGQEAAVPQLRSNADLDFASAHLAEILWKEEPAV